MWFHIGCLQLLCSDRTGAPSNVRRQTRLSGATLDSDFKAILRIPIVRGGKHGIVGNGKDIIAVWKIFGAMCTLGVERVPDNWRQNIGDAMFEEVADQIQYDYFCCGKCNQWL